MNLHWQVQVVDVGRVSISDEQARVAYFFHLTDLEEVLHFFPCMQCVACVIAKFQLCANSIPKVILRDEFFALSTDAAEEGMHL